MATLEELLHDHPLFAGAPAELMQLVAGCARNRIFHAGEYLFREGDPANEVFLIREGRVALEINAPGRVAVVIETLTAGEFAGASWLIPPYLWVFDARAIELTRTTGIDAACLRGKCDADHDLGYEMMKRFLPAVVKRLHATRLQILDVYGRH